jgi:sec-independent protein translocase protein TatA
MDFLGIGWGEILLILMVALLLWGPGKIIEISRSIGKMVHAFKKAAGDLTVQVSRELEEQKKESTPVSHNKS